MHVWYNYIMKYWYMRKNTSGDLIGNVIYKEIAGDTLNATMAAYNAAKENHDLCKYTAMCIYDIVNTEEE
mgnify:CR=1 FL=1